ncbi:MAG: 1-acyl-sn-glycerol-3-phosphate acyltransferase [Thermoanaerobaculia bacterium]|nr:1-acyl-sn-glycerol-3-phosphate acyltransferase [Thermoanaerobaculia bacterium]
MRGPIRRAVARAHFLLTCVVGALSFVGLSLGGLLYVALRPRGSAPVHLARTLHWIVTTLVGWRITVEDHGHVAESVPAILMVSHKSNLDIVVYGGIYPKRAVVIGKKEVAKIPVFGWFFRATGNILLDRKDLPSAISSIAAAAARVREERISVWVFPEGHRNASPTLLPFKKGAFHLALAAKVPIVPIVCTSLGDLLDAHRLLVFPGRIRIRVLPAISTEGLGEGDLEKLMETVRARMQEAQDRLAAEAADAKD